MLARPTSSLTTCSVASQGSLFLFRSQQHFPRVDIRRLNVCSDCRRVYRIRAARCCEVDRLTVATVEANLHSISLPPPRALTKDLQSWIESNLAMIEIDSFRRGTDTSTQSCRTTLNPATLADRSRTKVPGCSLHFATLPIGQFTPGSRFSNGTLLESGECSFRCYS